MYDSSPERADLPLTAAEVDLIAAGAEDLAADGERILHLLARVRATLRQEERRRQDLREQLAAMAESAGRREDLDDRLRSLERLDEAERARLMDAGWLREVERLRAAEAQAKLDGASARMFLNRVRATLAEIAERGEDERRVCDDIRLGLGL